jgi:hypothetical protein
MKRLVPEFPLSDAEFERLAEVGRISGTNAMELRTVLDRNFTNYRLSRYEFDRTPRSKLLSCSFESLRYHSSAILNLIHKHPDVRSRLAGALILLKAPNERLRPGGTSRAQQRLQKRVAAAKDLKAISTLLARLPTRGREYDRKATSSNNPPLELFIGSLLIFWRRSLKRRIRNSAGEDGKSGSATTLFVHACLDIAGPKMSLETVRVRISRVKATMDRNRKAGRGWTVWSQSRNKS